MKIDQEGNILLRTYESRDGGSVYDVFDHDGTFINQVVLPEVFDSCEIAGGFLYQIDSSNEEGVFVRKFRLE